MVAKGIQFLYQSIYYLNNYEKKQVSPCFFLWRINTIYYCNESSEFVIRFHLADVSNC